MDADKGFIMIEAMRDLIRFLFGYCSECCGYFRYHKEYVASGYMISENYYVCTDCAQKMRNMNQAEWAEYHVNC